MGCQYSFHHIWYWYIDTDLCKVKPNASCSFWQGLVPDQLHTEMLEWHLLQNIQPLMLITLVILVQSDVQWVEWSGLKFAAMYCIIIWALCHQGLLWELGQWTMRELRPSRKLSVPCIRGSYLYKYLAVSSVKTIMDTTMETSWKLKKKGYPNYSDLQQLGIQLISL